MAGDEGATSAARPAAGPLGSVQAPVRALCLCLIPLLLAIPRLLQGQSAPCGDLTDSVRDAYAVVKPIFFDDAYAYARRDLGLVPVAVAGPASLLVDPTQCAALVGRLDAELRKRSDWPNIVRWGYRFQIMRVGPYDAVIVSANSRPGLMNDPDLSPIYVFRSENRQYLGLVGVW
jgi:hypothetical protein